MRSRSSAASALTSRPGARRRISGKSICRLRRSVSTASATPGYWTLTATSRPSCVSARWTWPIEAAANASSSKAAKCSDSGPPSSPSIRPRIFLKETGLTSSRRVASVCLKFSRSPSGIAEKSTVESTWPIFIAAPRIWPSWATSSRASAAARSPVAASAASSLRRRLAAWVPAQRRPWPATSPPKRRVRATREVGGESDSRSGTTGATGGGWRGTMRPRPVGPARGSGGPVLRERLLGARGGDADRAADARAAEAAVAHRVLGQVLLVVALGVVERAGLGQLGRDLAVARGLQLGLEGLAGGQRGLALGRRRSSRGRSGTGSRRRCPGACPGSGRGSPRTGVRIAS